MLTNKPKGDASSEAQSPGAVGGPAPAGGAAVTAWPWWASAVVLFALAVAAVLACIAAVNSGGERFGAAPVRALSGAAFQLTHGGGHVSGTMYVLESMQDGFVSLSTDIAPFAAEKYPRVEWDLRSVDPPAELAFAWRTRENPRRTYSKPIHWLDDRVVPLKLDAIEGWRGTIVGVALVARGAMPAPLEVRSLTLPSTTLVATLGETLAQWGASLPLKDDAISLPFDAERIHFVAIAQAMAIACALAIVACVGTAYLRRRSVDRRVPWAIFAAAWILLDLRWQVNLACEVAAAARQFGGKTGDEKALAADDAQLVALALELKRALPPPPARVIVLSDSEPTALRVSHFLLPLNASWNTLARGEQREPGKTAPPGPAVLRSGDHVVLLFYRRLRYDAERRALVWPDGASLRAEIVVAKPDALLVRII